MYSTCVVCTAPLGRNEAIEHFPVGTRLAFDAAKGLLWVVCRRCERWNLTPLEERWEAIEECERAYRDARTRVATDNIGLARLRDGTELVRIGKPLRPELAAWRYGDQFGQRRRRALIGSGLFGGALVGGAIATPLVGLPLAALGAVGAMLLPVAVILTVVGTQGPVLLRPRWVRDDEGHWLLVTANDLPHFRIAGDTAARDGWALRLGYRQRAAEPTLISPYFSNVPSPHTARLTGEAALDAARQFLPMINVGGASRAVVARAVDTISTMGSGRATFAGVAARIHEYGARQSFGDTGSLHHLPTEVQLALEMAAFEDQERLALEGELAGLERAWRDADELAGIADRLLEPPGVAGALDRLRGRLSRGQRG